MTMPWTFDLLLPPAERYASLRFRRVSRRFDVGHLDYGDAVHLCAAVSTLTLPVAQKILGWSTAGKREYSQLLKYMLAQGDDVDIAVQQNRENYTRAEGLHVLAVMKEHGFRYGKVPEIVRFAFLDMRDAGMSQPAIAAAVGLSLDQVRVMANGPRKVRATLPLSRAGLVAN